MGGKHRVVVVGGGFAGLQAALHLRRADVELTLVDRRNFHLFQPLAYQVATGALNPGEICYPLRVIFHGRKNVQVILGEVTAFDLGGRGLRLATPAGPRQLVYDTLIVAGGSRYDYFGHPEWQRTAAELKSLEGALDIRSRILLSLEVAELEPDADRRAALLTFAVVGGGPTGVEMAGQIAEIARDSHKDFRVADTARARVLLIEAGPRLLSSFPPRLSAKAARALEHLGVTPLVGHTVSDLDETGVVVRHGQAEQRIAARTIVWAAGVRASEIAGVLATAAGLEVDRNGRIVVEPDLSLRGHPEVLAIGDMVSVRGRGPYPGVAPVAMQMGRHAAKVVRVRLGGGSAGAFTYWDKGNLATIGRACAVADLRGLHLSGFPAWFMWLTVHLWFLMGFRNRLLVMLEWILSFVSHGREARLITHPHGDERADNVEAGSNMTIVVIGGSGLIGSKVVADLASHGHRAVAASLESGVNTLTGEGLPAVLKGAQVVVDVSNSRAFDEAAATEFFATSTRNLLSHEAAAGVRHHVALSVVGTERPSEIGYFHAKNAQEQLIKESSIPYSIVHATQFFELFQRIADDATDGDTVHLPPVLVEPMAADDVAHFVARVAAGAPLNGTIDVAGPEQFRFDDFIRTGLSARHDRRDVISDPRARYYGAVPGERALVPIRGAELAETRFADWLSRPAGS